MKININYAVGGLNIAFGLIVLLTNYSPVLMISGNAILIGAALIQIARMQEKNYEAE